MKVRTEKYKQVLKDFNKHIESSKSIPTGNHYGGHIKEFLWYLENRQILSLKRINAQVMKEYFNYLTTRPKQRGEGTLSISSINDHLSTLRMFSKRMQKGAEITKAIPVPNNLRLERDDERGFLMSRQILTTDQVKEVFNSCESPFEKALFALAYGSGLRRSTLAKLKDSQINYTKGMVTALKAKYGKTREVPISNHFVKVLKDYSYWRLNVLAKTNSREQRFFVDSHGKPMTGGTLNERLKKVIRRTGNKEIMDKNITLHCLRHSITAHLLDSGATYEYVKTFLGHSFVDTSSIYAKRRKIKSMYTI